MAPEARRQVAEYLGGGTLQAADKTHPGPALYRRCSRGRSGSTAGRARLGIRQRAVYSSRCRDLSPDDVAHLELQWAFEFPGAIRARSQPAIAYGAVFTGSHDGTVYSLDLKSGCVRWTSKMTAEVRTAIVVGVAGGSILATSSPGPMLWMPTPASNFGTSRSTIIPTRLLPERQRSRRGFVCACFVAGSDDRCGCASTSVASFAGRLLRLRLGRVRFVGRRTPSPRSPGQSNHIPRHPCIRAIGCASLE